MIPCPTQAKPHGIARMMPAHIAEHPEDESAGLREHEVRADALVRPVETLPEKGWEDNTRLVVGLDAS